MEKTISDVIGDFALLLITLMSLPILIIVIVYLMKRHLIGERRRLLTLRGDIEKWLKKVKSNLILLHLNNVKRDVEDLSESAIMSMGVGEIWRYIKRAGKAYDELDLILNMQIMIYRLMYELDSKPNEFSDEKIILESFLNQKISGEKITDLKNDYEYLFNFHQMVFLRYVI